MKKFIVISLVILVASACLANPKKTFDSHADKISHALAGGFVAGVAFKHAADPSTMLWHTFVVGGLKEAFDYKYANKWDNWDWFATKR